jgi:hypothetical protein
MAPNGDRSCCLRDLTVANFTGLDLERLRERTPSGGFAGPSAPLEPLFQRPITRRLALQAGALGATAVRNMGSIFRRFRFLYQDGRALFYLGEDLLWIVDPERFAGRPRLRVEHFPRLLALTLREARYPGTRVPADFRCRCHPTAFGWWIRLEMDFLGFSAQGPLESWLEGVEPLRFQATESSRLIASRFSPLALALAGPARIDFLPSWHLSLTGRHALALTLGGGEIPCDSAVLSLPEPSAASLSATPARKRSRVDLARGRADWSCLSRSWPVGEGELAIAGNTLETLQIESDETPAGRRLFFLAASPPGIEAGRLLPGPNFQRSGESLVLPLAGVRLAGAFEPAGRQVAVLADLHGEASWLDGATTRLKLGNPSDSAAFELTERDGRLDRLALAPALLASVTALDGALGLETPPPAPTRVALLAQAGEAPVSGPCATASGCAQGGGVEISVPDLCLSVLRPDDLLILRFELRNLRLQDRWFSKPRLERIDRTKPAFLIVHFPPQHVAERAFFVDQDQTEPPERKGMDSRLAGESRLAFRLADGHDRLAFDLPTLLNWDPSIFEPVLVPATRMEEDIARPACGQTDIEFPWRLHLSPDRDAVWRHAAEPVTHEGRTELWHTRLAPAKVGGPAPGVRAVWAEFDKSEFDKSEPQGWHKPKDQTLPFRTSLQDLDRYQIVEATHRCDTDPAPVAARLLALSAQGAWSDLYGEWPCNSKRLCNSLDRWHHVATLGRDQFVRVERRGVQYPLGHRVTVITETRRQLEPIDYVLDGQTRHTLIAFLRQRIFIKIKEKLRSYGNWDMAWREIEILDDQTPNLNDPRNDETGGGLPTSGGTWKRSAFWPTVGSTVFRFHIRGVDFAGNSSTWEMPLIFVEQSCDPEDDPKAKPEDLSTTRRLQEVADHYAKSPRRIVSLSGQTLAMAPSLRKGDTEIAAETLEFDGRLKVHPPQNPCERGYIAPGSTFALLYSDPCEPPFWPIFNSARGRVPAIESLLGMSQTASLTPLPIGCDDAFETFAALVSPGEIQAGFHEHSNRSGGVLGPSPHISHLSRRFGPVGLVPPAANAAPGAALLTAKPAAAATPVPPTTSGANFFSPDANILGTLTLKDLIGTLDPGKGDIPALLSLVTPYADGPDLLEQSLNWNTTTLAEKDFGILAFLPKSDTVLSLDGSLSVWIGQPDAVRFSMMGSLKNFDVRIGATSAGVLIHFENLSYEAASDGATHFDVKLGDVTFLGALAFIQTIAMKLQELMGIKAGVEIDLQPNGVTVWMPPINIESIEFGIFHIKNINIRSWARLPFVKEPVEFGFAFGRADAPCELSVGIFGGRFYMLAILDTAHGGIRQFEAAFEFGALRDLSFGPAHGQVYVLGGVFYSITVEGGLRTTRLAAYVRAGGSVDVLGLITAYIDLYIGLLYEDDGQQSYLVGEASLTIGFKIGFIEQSVTLRRSERLAGSAGSGQQRSSAWQIASLDNALPAGKDCVQEQSVRFEDAMPYCEWECYRAAFA